MQEAYMTPSPSFSEIVKLVKKHGCRGAEDLMSKKAQALNKKRQREIEKERKEKKKEESKSDKKKIKEDKKNSKKGLNPVLKRWTVAEDEVFESALTIYEDDMVGRWEIIAGLFPDKSVNDVRARYQELLMDIAAIEAAFANVSHFQGSRRSKLYVNP